MAGNAIAALRSCCILKTERFTLTTNFDMETKLDNTTEPQHDAKLPVSHSFSHDFLQLSTDYKLLWELVQSGKRVPAWLVYNDKYEKPIWDLVEVKNIWGEPNDYSIGTRGIGYEGAKTFKWFEAICQKYSLHFVCPQNCG